MRAFLDTCVIYPTVMREMLLGVAEVGLFDAKWSPRVLEEWARASRKFGEDGEILARSEIAALAPRFPRALITIAPDAERAFWLPDPADQHVLAAAVHGACDAIVTLNAKDFPKNILSDHDIVRFAPDEFLMRLWQTSPEPITRVAGDVLAVARDLSGEDWTIRALMKKARLPRIGKAIAAQLDL